MNDLTAKRNAWNCTEIPYQSNTCDVLDGQSVVLNDVRVRTDDMPAEDQSYEDRKVAQSDQELALNELGEFKLAQRLMDRVNRITIHKVVIDLHPVKSEKRSQKKRSHRRSKVDPIFDS